MEKLEWNITAVAEMIKELNEYGSLAKNAIAGIYNMFRYKISEKWQGKSYNSVVRYFNSYSNDWITMVKFLGEEIPTGLAQICMNQAEVNQSEVQLSSSYYLASDNNNPDIYPLNESNENLNTTLEPEEVEQYLRGSTDPSVKVRADLAIFYLESYINVFNNHAPDYNYDEAVLNLCNGAKPYIEKFKSNIDEIMEKTIKVALGEIETIEELNVETIEIADEATDGEVLSGSENISDGEILADGTDASSKIPRYLNTNSAEYNNLRKEMYADLDEEYVSQTEVDAAKKHVENLRARKAPAEQIREAESKYNELSDRRQNQTITESDVQAARKQWENFEEQNTEAGKISAANKKAEDVAKQYEKDMTEAAAKRDQEVNAAYEKYSKAEKAAQEPVDEANQAVDDALKAYYEKYGNPDNQ